MAYNRSIYARGKVRTRVLVYGDTIRESDMQPRLLRLKRVPLCKLL
jgi:hypothetical protein